MAAAFDPGVLLQVRGLHKSYAAPVLTDVDFDLRSGEVHALLGANGAGKTTLARIVSGLMFPDQADMQLAGEAYAPADKMAAERRGVHIVQQELNLIDTLSVAENLFLNCLDARLGFLRKTALRGRACEALAAVGLDEIDPDTPVSRLGIGQQQLIEIAAALSRRCRLLILDEPTAALTGPQVDLLFQHIERLKHEGVGIIYVSHRLDEIRRIADRATILRDGRVVATEPVERLTVEQIVELMVGREVRRRSQHRRRELGPVALRVTNLTRRPLVQNVSFEVFGGEVFGIAGLVGSGRTELLRAIFGADAAESGTVQVRADGVPRRFRHPCEAVGAGLAMIPEDRKSHGLLLSQSIRINTTLSSLRAVSKPRGWISADREDSATEHYSNVMGVQRQSIEQPVEQLSGGNQQKVVVGRWLMRGGDVFLFDEPTRGIDVAAKAVVYDQLNELADDGKSLVVVSSDLEELLAICDRIGVMSAGRMVATFERGRWSQQAIMNAAISGYLEASMDCGNPRDFQNPGDLTFGRKH